MTARAPTPSLPSGRGLSRRAWALGAGAGLLVPLLPALASEAAPTQRRSVALMGTKIDLVLHGAPAPALDRAADEALAEMQRLATMMSRYESGNALAAVHAAAGRGAVPVPPEMLAALQAAQRVSEHTAGAFDVTVGALSSWHFDAPQAPLPTEAEVRAERRHVGWHQVHLDARAGTVRLAHPDTRLDLGGIAKLPILQAGMDVLARHGVPSAMINGGGDVLVRGGLDGRPWRIGVRDAQSPERLLAVIPLADGVVASSGDYERGFVRHGRRYHHVLDPATGFPTREVHGVTLVARHASAVTGLGTAAMVLGPARGARLLASAAERRALMMNTDGTVWCSTELRSHLVPPPDRATIRGLA